MKKTVTLYKYIIIALGCCNRPVYLLDNYKNDPDNGVSCEGAQAYYLPDGYTVSQSNGGTLEFYDANGNHCPLMTGNHDKPIIVIDGGHYLYLDPVSKQ